MVSSNEQPRVPAGRRDGGQFTQADKAHETTDLTTTFGDEAFIDQIVAVGREAYVAGISAERVGAFLEAVGRDDVLSNHEAAMRLSPWKGLKKDNGELEKKKETWLTSEMSALVEEAPNQPYRYRFTEEGRQAALHNLLLEARDRKRFEASSAMPPPTPAPTSTSRSVSQKPLATLANPGARPSICSPRA